MNIETRPLLKAKILSMLLKFANEKGDIDYNSDELEQLFRVEGVNEDRLWELNEVGAINFEQVGDDGFKPITIIGVKPETYDHLLNCLAKITSDQNLLNQRVTSLLNHNPKKLIVDVNETQNYIKEVKERIRRNDLLKPLEKPLLDIESHFDSISRVAENYDDVYKNILKPVQEEGRSGVRATVKWAVISIIASWLLGNYKEIKQILSGLVS